MKLNVNLPELIEVDGNLVEKDALKIAEALARYDPNLYIVGIDPGRAGINDAPYLVCEMCQDGQLRRVFEAWQIDERILERVYAADQRRFDTLEQITKANAENDDKHRRRYRDVMDMKKDLVGHIVASRKSEYSFVDDNGEKVTIREDMPQGIREADKRKSFSG